MKKTLFLPVALLFQLISFSQNTWDKATAEIVAEGKRLYRSEMASWYGTDIFMDKFKEKIGRVGGYLSYVDKDTARCIFYSNDPQPKILGTMSFDSTYDVRTASVSGTERDLTEQENALYLIRRVALMDISKDTIYRRYPNTNFNLVPMIFDKQKKVYILTGTTANGKVVIGNDYLLNFNDSNKLVSRKKLHQSILYFDFGAKAEEKQIGGMHTHLPENDFITPTDICTLMLYEKLARWETHIVVSEKYVCIWNCKTDQLTTMTKSAWDKMSKSIEKKSGN